MEETMKKNQDTMKANQQLMFQRQLQLQNFMRERQMAMQLARARDMFNWCGSFYVLALLGLARGFKKTKNPGFLGPLLPLTFIIGYQADLAYGGKMKRMRAEAEKILENEGYLLLMPGSGLPTIQELDQLAAAQGPS
eukprot:GHVU01065996.1.p1 GENE.GHVU01065996.1~~GHVU01065996.1.p1  ORF type:complete len:137 (-),score=14.17 GHVU01065996.1:2062-2472(-)